MTWWSNKLRGKLRELEIRNKVLNPFSDGMKGHVQVTGGGLIGPPLYGDPRRPQT